MIVERKDLVLHTEDVALVRKLDWYKGETLYAGVEIWLRGAANPTTFGYAASGPGYSNAPGESLRNDLYNEIVVRMKVTA